MPEITLIPKKQQFELKLSLKDAFFYLPIIFLVLVVLIFLGFFVYNFILQRSINSVNEEIIAVESERNLVADENFINEVFNLNSRIQNLKGVLDNHVYPSNLFAFFEKITMPKTKFVNLAAGFTDGKISTRGETDGYIGMVKQIIIFSRDPNIKEAKVTGIALAPNGKIQFGLELSFNKKILLEGND